MLVETVLVASARANEQSTCLPPVTKLVKVINIIVTMTLKAFFRGTLGVCFGVFIQFAPVVVNKKVKDDLGNFKQVFLDQSTAKWAELGRWATILFKYCSSRSTCHSISRASFCLAVAYI